MKLYDCFLFNGELDLLEIRLNIMYDYVDKFVIAEGEETLMGLSKPAYLPPQRERFETFADKIIYLTVPKTESIPCAWSKEAFHRNCLIGGVKDARDSDYVLLSDLDEIPDPEKLYYYLTRINEPFTLQQRNHCYYFNTVFENSPEWHGTVAMRKSSMTQAFGSWDRSYYGFSDVGLQKMRKIRKKCVQIPLCGWHYSYLLSDEDIEQKLKSFPHKEANTNEINNLDNIRKCKSELIPINPSGGKDKLSIYQIDESNTSKYVLENLEKYKQFIYS